MRKSLLLLITVFAFSFANAQYYWESDYYQGSYTWNNDDYYPAWKSIGAELDDWLVITDDDSAWVVEGLTNILDFDGGIVANSSDTADWKSSSARYVISGSGDELTVKFDGGVLDTEWSTFTFSTYEWKGDGPSTALHDDVMWGTMVDMIAEGGGYKTIGGEVYIPSSLNSYAKFPGRFPIRASVMDAHGHEWNAGGDPIDTVEVFDAWTPFEIDYDKIIKGEETYGKGGASPGDGYQMTFHGITPPDTLMALAGQWDRGGSIRVPIDFTKIVEVRFYLAPGEKDALTGDIKFRNLYIGNENKAATYHTGAQPDFYSSLEDVEQAAIKSIEVINILGQTVTTVSSLEEVPAGVSILKITLEDGSIVVEKVGIVK